MRHCYKCHKIISQGVMCGNCLVKHIEKIEGYRILMQYGILHQTVDANMALNSATSEANVEKYY